MLFRSFIFDVKASQPLTASSVVAFDAPPPHERVVGLRSRLGPDWVVPYAPIADVVSARNPYSLDQVTLTVTDPSALLSQIDTSRGIESHWFPILR